MSLKEKRKKEMVMVNILSILGFVLLFEELIRDS